MLQFWIGLMTWVYNIPSALIPLSHSTCLSEIVIVGHVIDLWLPLSALLLQPPKIPLFCNSLPYLCRTYREEGNTGAAPRNSHIYTSKWIIQVAKSNECMQPLPVTGDEHLFSCSGSACHLFSWLNWLEWGLWGQRSWKPEKQNRLHRR